MKPRILAFVDTETTGLNPRRHEVWEIAVIARDLSLREDKDAEFVFHIKPDLLWAEDKALQVNRYHDRAPGLTWQRETDVVIQLGGLLRDAVILGSNPGFDVSFLEPMFAAHGLEPTWHHRPVDVPTLAAGYQAARGWPVEFPVRSRDISAEFGVDPPGPGEAHTALADARWMRDLFDAVIT